MWSEEKSDFHDGFNACTDLLMPENEQLRAQLSQAQETIADFRSALKEIREGNALMAEGEGSDPQVYMDMAKHWMKEADKVLQKHPDSTEVKG